MKIAIYNPFYGEPTEEKEIACRIQIAGRAIGLEVEEVIGPIAQVLRFNPDFILSLHHLAPKLCGIPTYGCLWNPPVFMNNDPKLISNIMSLDGFLSSGPVIDRWIKDRLYATDKNYFITPFYTTCYATDYQPLDFRDPKLLYCGTNWDGARFSRLFELISQREYMYIYGPQHQWTHISNAYHGSIPFDGMSILTQLRETGVGLCLHTDEHISSGIPSMRIFEIVAAGAVAICQNHPFIKETFGDSVLYIDTDESPEQIARQIDRCMQYIKYNPDQARDMTARAHRIFSESYTLDKFLKDIVMRHEMLVAEKFSPMSTYGDSKQGLVQVIMRVGGRPVEIIRRALESVVQQTYMNIEVIMVRYLEVPGLDKLINEFNEKLRIRVITSNNTGFRSSTLWEGLQQITSEYFAILDDDDVFFPNHLASLVNLLKKYGDVNLAYSGSIRIQEQDGASMNCMNDEEELAYFEPFDMLRLMVHHDNFITSNAWVGRAAAIEPWMLHDPEFTVGEDFFLLMCLLTTSRFIFSYEATCCFYWRKSKQDNSTFLDVNIWENDVKRIKTLLHPRSFWTKLPSTEELTTASLYNTSAKPATVADLEAALAENNKIINEIYSSSSWRLTYPIRALKTWLLQKRGSTD